MTRTAARGCLAQADDGIGRLVVGNVLHVDISEDYDGYPHHVTIQVDASAFDFIVEGQEGVEEQEPSEGTSGWRQTWTYTDGAGVVWSYTKAIPAPTVHVKAMGRAA